MTILNIFGTVSLLENMASGSVILRRENSSFSCCRPNLRWLFSWRPRFFQELASCNPLFLLLLQLQFFSSELLPSLSSKINIVHFLLPQLSKDNISRLLHHRRQSREKNPSSSQCQGLFATSRRLPGYCREKSPDDFLLLQVAKRDSKNRSRGFLSHV